MLLFMCSISGNICSWEYEVQNFHCLSQLLKGFRKKMINRNHRHKRKLANIATSFRWDTWRCKREKKIIEKYLKIFYLTEYTRCNDSQVMSHLEIIKLSVCLENTGTIWWMTQYGNWSQENNLEEYKNIYHWTTWKIKKGDLNILFVMFTSKIGEKVN